MGLIAPVEPALLSRVAQQALRAQPGTSYDLHSALFPPDRICTAQIVVHQPGVVCGLDAAAAVFEAVDATLVFEPLAWDSAPVAGAPAAVAEISGHAAALLAAEPAALTLVARLSGIATHVHRHVEAIGHTQARILDTPTSAGTLEGYAIECGGGYTRLPGEDPMLITTAHVELAGGIRAAIDGARSRLPRELPIQVEIATLDDAREAFAAQADALLLGDMGLDAVRWVVNHAPPHTWLHATGRITLADIEPIALAGVHAITPHSLVETAATIDTSLVLIEHEASPHR